MSRRRPSTRLIAVAIALIAAAIASLGASSGVAKRAPGAKAAASLFGLVLQGDFSKPIDAAALRVAKPDTVRILFVQNLISNGSGACTATGGACDWSATDAQVGGAAQAGAQALPFLFGASSKPPLRGAAKASWDEFITAAVDRYGSGGTYWKGPYQVEYAGAKPKPVRVWQVWNEPGSPAFFEPKPDVAKYAKLLAASRTTIIAADKHAKIMLAGLFSSADRGAIRGRIPAIQFLSDLYNIRRAAERFDIVALHPYARAAGDMIGQVKQIRAVMKANGDGKKPLAITELGWSSNEANGSLLAKGVEGQASTLTSAFKRLLKGRTRYRLDTVDWYALRDTPEGIGSCKNCPFAGLLQADGTPKPAYNAFLSFTG